MCCCTHCTSICWKHFTKNCYLLLCTIFRQCILVDPLSVSVYLSGVCLSLFLSHFGFTQVCNDRLGVLMLIISFFFTFVNFILFSLNAYNFEAAHRLTVNICVFSVIFSSPMSFSSCLLSIALYFRQRESWFRCCYCCCCCCCIFFLQLFLFVFFHSIIKSSLHSRANCSVLFVCTMLTLLEAYTRSIARSLARIE